MQMGFLASVRLGEGHADILHDGAATKNRHQSRLQVPALATVNARRWALSLSLQLPMGLGVAHQVNFEVNSYDFGQSDFLEFWGVW